MAYLVLAGVSNMKFIAVLTTSFVVSCPSLALACSVCFDPNDEARIAFIVTTGLLSFVPLIAIWCLIRWFKKRALEHELYMQELDDQPFDLSQFDIKPLRVKDLDSQQLDSQHFISGGVKRF